MSPKRENSLLAVQAQNGMWHELWVVALDEAYSARDAARRSDELQGMTERQVVDVYFGYHPEMRQWTESHIQAGTCEAAAHDLREMLKLTRERRGSDRRAGQGATVTTAAAQPDDEDWTAPFKSGPAIWPTTQPPDIDGVAEEPSERRLRDVAPAAFQDWLSSFAEYPTKLEADQWAKQQGYSTGSVRKLHRGQNPRKQGDHRKRQR